ncbi:Sensory histidine protein kinase [Candidatus Terasakiella magnetica]|nr:Sensory histidine protein kinase [Candidatus Terasakiella magnetica]
MKFPDKLRPSQGSGRLITTVVLLNLFIVSLVGIVLAWHLEHERTKATLVSDNLGRVLEQNLSRFIDKIDLTLLAVVDEIERQERSGGIDRKILETFLARHDARLPEALGLRVVNSQGMIDYAVGNVTAASMANITDRAHFTRHRDNPELGLFISQPIIGRLNPQPMLIFARRRAAPDGSFSGIVHVAVTIEALTTMFSTVNIGEYGSVGLWDKSPMLLARHSPISAPSSGVTTPSPALRDLIAADSAPAAYITTSGVDGLERIFFYRRVENRPLYLVVGVSSQDYLQGWRREASYLIGLVALFLLGSITAAAVIHHTLAAVEMAHADADAARRRSDMVLAAVGEGICGVDAEGKVTFINAAARRMLGWNEDEGIGISLHTATHHHYPDGREYPLSECPFGKMLCAKAITPDIRISDEVYWRKDGTSFPVEYTGAPIVENDRIIGAVNVFRDISDRKEAEEATARTLATTQVLGNCLRLSLDDLSLDQILNAALKEVLSLPWLNLEKRGSIFIVDGARLRMAAQLNLPPEISTGCANIAIGQCLCGTAAARGRTIFVNHVDHQHVTTFEGMSEHGHYCVPIIGGDKILGVLNAYVGHGHRHDDAEQNFLDMFAHTLAGIIKRKNAEESLRDSEELAKTLMNAPIDAAFLLDTDGLILAANDALASRFATTAEALMGLNFFSLLPPDLAEARRAVFDQVLATKTPFHTHDERDNHAFDNRIYPVVDSDGNAVRIAVFSRDVTEQRQAARAIEKALSDLERSNQELEQFAYVASHDLRQPLRMISSYLGLIERRMGGDITSDMKEFIRFAVGGAKRMDGLILGLLEYSRIGRGEQEFAPVPLDEALSDALLNLKILISEADAVVEPPTQSISIPGDRTELTRLFQNLIANAIKYRSPDRPPRVEVSWTRTQSGWQVSVSDNGTGIAPEDYDRVFGIFQRLVSHEAVEGTGIGLAVCKKIVEHHGGRIWIESQPGHGSTFHFTLRG